MIKEHIINLVAGQSYAPWIDPSKIQDSLTGGTLPDSMNHWMRNQVIDCCTWLWQGTVHTSFWIAVIGGVICILFYVVSKNIKFLQWTGILCLGDVLIQGINSVIG